MHLFSLQCDNISQISLLFFGSSPVVGSSRNTIGGSPTNATPNVNLLLIPPDNSLTKYFLNFFNLTSSNIFSTINLIFDSSLFFILE